jgi:hypothetical protein
MLEIILLAILIYSFWNIYLAWIIFAAIAALFNLWIYSVQYSSTATFNTIGWVSEEIKILKKYHLYFCFPFASKFNSIVASAIYIFGAVLAIILLWHGYWLQAIFIAINAIASALISPKLNPRFFLHDAVERRNDYQFYEEMAIVDAVCNKISNKQNESGKNNFKEK